MPTFEFATPKSLEDAFTILSRGNGEVRALAGGTDLIDQVNVGRRQPSIVMDIKSIPEMKRLEYDQEGLHIGGGVSCTDVYNFAAVKENYISIAEASALIGSIQIQNRACVGGNVCNAAPSGDTIPPLLVHGAKAVIAGPRGRRETSLEAFFLGPGQTVLDKDEVLLEIVVPPPPANSASRYLRFIPREEMDIAVVGVASFLVLEQGSKRCQQARIALAAVAPTPVRAKDAEAVLEGQVLNEALIREAGEKAVNAATPITDVRGSIEYRKELVKVLTRRTLAKCLETLGA